MNSKVTNNNNEGINFKKGYLYVKLPLNLGAFVGQYKFWSKKWIQFDYRNNENEDNFVDILVFRNQKSENFIYRKSFQSKNTAIFRSRSRTQNYAFTICDNNVAVIHLSANSETESQQWMRCLRNSLWPPNTLMEFENSISGHFYASIIDNEKSHRSGLLGAYGYLQLSNANLVLTHPQTGYVIQEWLLSKHTVKNPFENVLKVMKNSSSFSGIQNIFIYCRDSSQIMERINGMNQMNRINYLENEVKCREELERLSLNGLSYSSLTNKQFDRNIQKSDPIKCNTFRIRSLTEIPESMLNSSLSSNNFSSKDSQYSENIYSEPSDPFDYIDEDIYEDIEDIEDIDRIYEEIVTKNDNNIYLNYSPKDKSSSQPIEIRTEKRDNHLFGYDMFSQITKRANIPLIESKLSIKRSNPLENQESDNDYYEMKPIFTDKQSVNFNHSSDNCDYVYMKSFSI